MIFLIAYDRRTQTFTRPMESFTDEERVEARRRRFDVQQALPSEQGRYEVVLLEASSEADIRQTHARYFAPDERSLIEAAKANLRDMSDAGRRRRTKATKA